MRQKIVLSESQLYSVIKESVRSIILEAMNPRKLKDGDTLSRISLKTGQYLSPEQTKKYYSGYYKINPEDLKWDNERNLFVYKPPKKNALKRIEGESEAEYEKRVLGSNDKYRNSLEEISGEEWRPVVNNGNYFGGSVDYSEYYEVSDYGRIKVLNNSNGMKSYITRGYEARDKDLQVHLNLRLPGEDPKNTCPPVKYIVANAFLGAMDRSKFRIIHKNGDWRDNRVDNLMWVEKDKIEKPKQENN